MSSHFDTFYALEPEKKERIIMAILDEIAEKGFKKASTNAIVKRANISKGMLFYYFGSKEELFNFLIEYMIEFVKQEYVKKFTKQTKTRDFIERCRSLAKIKRETLSHHPKMIRFFENSFSPDHAEYFNKYSNQIKEVYHAVRSSLYDDVDYSLFRKDIEAEKTLTYIRWLTERYEQELTQKIVETGHSYNAHIDEAFNDYDVLLVDLKKIFYKNNEEEDER